VLDKVALGHVLLQALLLSHTTTASWLFSTLLLTERQTETAGGPCNNSDESRKVLIVAREKRFGLDIDDDGILYLAIC
jgi:Flp pilus assembly protein CpaB